MMDKDGFLREGVGPTDVFGTLQLAVSAASGVSMGGHAS